MDRSDMASRSRRMPLALHRIWVVSLGVVLALGCSSSRSTDSGANGDSRATLDELSSHEDFDASPYADSMPVLASEMQHDVPDLLMHSQAADSLRAFRRVQGFRIQIHSSLDKEAAVAAEEEVRGWWRAMPEDDRPTRLFPEELPVYLRFYQPYYRVRVGDFAARDLAEQALRLLERGFPRAFIAVDTVTVGR